MLAMLVSNSLAFLAISEKLQKRESEFSKFQAWLSSSPLSAGGLLPYHTINDSSTYTDSTTR